MAKANLRITTQHSRGRLHAVVLLGYTLLTAVMTWPAPRAFFVAIPGDSFDGWQNFWNLWWVKLALIDRIQNPYTTDLLYHPTGVDLYFHTLNPFNGAVTLPVQLTGGLYAAYNSVVLISWVLAGYGAFLLARWSLLRSGVADGVPARLGAFCAGLIFTFAPIHMAHLLGHMQVMALQWLPFYALALLRGLAAPDRRVQVRQGLLAGLFLILAGLCDWYFVLYLFLLTGLAVLWTWGQRRWLAGLITPGLAGILFAVVLWPILWPMVQAATEFEFMVRPPSDLYILSATLVDFLIPSRMHSLFRPDSFTWPGNQIAPVSERTLALGYAALVLAGIGLVARGRRMLFWVVAVLFFGLMALGPSLQVATLGWSQVPAVPVLDGWTPYEVVNRLVPFMRISRSVSRFAIMVQLGAAVLAAGGLAWLLVQLRLHVQIVVAVLVVALILLEYWVAPFPVSPPDTPDYYSVLAANPGDGAVLNLPMNYDRPGYLLYQTVHGRPLTVAYISRDDPRTLTERVPLLQHLRHLGPDILADDPTQVGMTVLNDLDVDYVVLDRYKMPGGAERAYTERLAEAVFAGATPEHVDDRLTVYAVPIVGEPQPYLELGPLNWGPLMQEEGARWRTLGEGAAVIRLNHVAQDAAITITYRGVGDATLAVTLPGDTTYDFGPAPDGTIVVVPVPAGTDQLTLERTGTVDILGLALTAE